MLSLDVLASVPLRTFVVPYIFGGQNFGYDDHRLVQSNDGRYEPAAGAVSAGLHAGAGLWLGPAFFVEARALWQFGMAENALGLSRATIRFPLAVGVRCCARPFGR
jgi:hypothetical protein